MRYVLLETERDFYEHYGKNAPAAIEAWAGNLATYERSAQTILVSTAAHDSAQELQNSLAHEGVGHSGINTFSPGEKRALLAAIIDAKDQPGQLASIHWPLVNSAYPAISLSERAEEVFCLLAESVARRRQYHEAAFKYAWQRSVVARSEPLQTWGLAQIAEHVAHGLRQNTRRQQIFPLTDNDPGNGS
ncbi:MAG: hypothetical protein LBQ32_12355 [Burkholderiaceae bacterium]|nr:hypothetical protein [Burkholderiaceae bacterium]